MEGQNPVAKINEQPAVGADDKNKSVTNIYHLGENSKLKVQNIVHNHFHVNERYQNVRSYEPSNSNNNKNLQQVELVEELHYTQSIQPRHRTATDPSNLSRVSNHLGGSQRSLSHPYRTDVRLSRSNRHLAAGYNLHEGIQTENDDDSYGIRSHSRHRTATDPSNLSRVSNHLGGSEQSIPHPYRTDVRLSRSNRHLEADEDVEENEDSQSHFRPLQRRTATDTSNLSRVSNHLGGSEQSIPQSYQINEWSSRNSHLATGYDHDEDVATEYNSYYSQNTQHSQQQRFIHLRQGSIISNSQRRNQIWPQSEDLFSELPQLLIAAQNNDEKTKEILSDSLEIVDSTEVLGSNAAQPVVAEKNDKKKKASAKHSVVSEKNDKRKKASTKKKKKTVTVVDNVTTSDEECDDIDDTTLFINSLRLLSCYWVKATQNQLFKLRKSPLDGIDVDRVMNHFNGDGKVRLKWFVTEKDQLCADYITTLNEIHIWIPVENSNKRIFVNANRNIPIKMNVNEIRLATNIEHIQNMIVNTAHQQFNQHFLPRLVFEERSEEGPFTVMARIVVRYIYSRGKFGKRVRLVVDADDGESEAHYDIRRTTLIGNRTLKLTALCRHNGQREFRARKTRCCSQIKLPDEKNLSFYIERAFQQIPVEVINGSHEDNICLFPKRSALVDYSYSRIDLNKTLDPLLLSKEPTLYKKCVCKINLNRQVAEATKERNAIQNAEESEEEMSGSDNEGEVENE